MTVAIATGALLKDRYRLERLLGRGGMASVWLGHDEVLDRPVAIKVLSDTIADDPDFVTRFRREARLAARLSHPNLVGVYDFSEEDERPYLVMQFVPGEDLGARVARGRPVDCERLARELLDAVDHIHAAGILHRDIKPQNILMEPDGTVKLLDFGIAQPHDATSLTQTGLVLGTRRYAAPEVMEGGAATERSDLYSCGVVLRLCLGGGSQTLRSLVEWLASPEAGARPASARQALARLERDGRLTGEPTEAFSPTMEQPLPPPWSSVASPAPGPPSSPSRSHRARLGAVAAVLGVLAVLAVGVALATGGSDETGGRRAAATMKQQHSGRSEKVDSSGGAGGAGASTESEAGAAEAEADAAAAPSAAESSEATPTASGSDPETGSALNEQGYALIQAGEFEAAVPILEEAVRAFPAGTEEVDYGYALFNLGHALRLSGQPQRAVPILEQRLQIPDQTATVQRELEAARSEAG